MKGKELSKKAVCRSARGAPPRDQNFPQNIDLNLMPRQIGHWSPQILLLHITTPAVLVWTLFKAALARRKKNNILRAWSFEQFYFLAYTLRFVKHAGKLTNWEEI